MKREYKEKEKSVGKDKTKEKKTNKEGSHISKFNKQLIKKGR